MAGRGGGGGAYQVLNDSNFGPRIISSLQGRFICDRVSLNPIRIIKGVELLFRLDPDRNRPQRATLPNVVVVSWKFFPRFDTPTRADLHKMEENKKLMDSISVMCVSTRLFATWRTEADSCRSASSRHRPVPISSSAQGKSVGHFLGKKTTSFLNTDGSVKKHTRLVPPLVNPSRRQLQHTGHGQMVTSSNKSTSTATFRL